jgi:hypothetical protein
MTPDDRLRRSKPRPQWDDTKEGPGLGPWIVGTLAFGVCLVIFAALVWADPVGRVASDIAQAESLPREW